MGFAEDMLLFRFLFLLKSTMAIILYKIHVDSLDFPYPQTTLNVYPDSQMHEVLKYVDDHNNKRMSIWDLKLGCRSDNTIENPQPKEI